MMDGVTNPFFPKIINNLLVDFLYMSNRNNILDDYFPAGSAEITSIKERINNQIQTGALQINGPILTLEQLQIIRNEDKKDAKKKFWYGQAITIICAIAAIMITILVR